MRIKAIYSILIKPKYHVENYRQKKNEMKIIIERLNGGNLPK